MWVILQLCEQRIDLRPGAGEDPVELAADLLQGGPDLGQLVEGAPEPLAVDAELPGVVARGHPADPTPWQISFVGPVVPAWETEFLVGQTRGRSVGATERGSAVLPWRA